MSSFREVIDLWPTPVALAQDLTEMRGVEVSVYRVRKWRERDSIPADYWQAVINAGSKRGFQITPGQLTQIADGGQTAGAAA